MLGKVASVGYGLGYLGDGTIATVELLPLTNRPLVDLRPLYGPV